MNRKFFGSILILFIFIFSQSSPSQIHLNSVSDTSKVQPQSNLDYRTIFNRTITAPQSEQVQNKPLSIFGVELFKKDLSNLAGEGSEIFILPPEYKLGPGDKIGVFLLGKVQENLEVTVNVEGKIFIPPVGVIYVWGLTMDELNALLLRKLSKYYDNFKLDLMLLQPKNVMVAVVGEVLRPGKYVLNAVNTVLDAIITAGGPTLNGSIRDIRLIRDSREFVSVDLYRFLMSGDNKYDEFLQAGDRIFVPLVQNQVSIEGEIKRPSIFELKSGLQERLTDLIDLGGGFTEYAFLDKIEISRLQPDGSRTLHYVDFRKIMAGDSTDNLLLKNDDKVQVYSKLDQIHERKVAIFGEIRKPGLYDLEDNMHLSDLILKAGNLTRKAYTLQAEVAKIDPGKATKYLKVNLQDLNNPTNGHTDIILEEDDQVFIRQIPEWEFGQTVEVRGEVRFPGRYSIIEDRTYLSEILKKAGGFTDEAFLQDATVVRRFNRSNLDKEFERLKEMRREEMSDLEYQYLVMRQNTNEVNRLVVDFEKLMLQNDQTQDVILQNGDVVVIPKAPTVVMVTGRVAHEGGVTYSPGAPLKYYLARAGGASWDADLKKTKVIKVSGEVLDDEDINEFHPGDVIWVPRKSDKKFWPVLLQSITVMAQLASIYLIIDTASKR